MLILDDIRPRGPLHDGDGSVASASRQRYEDPCRRRRAMPAMIASRRCLCEPGGEVNYMTVTVIEQYFSHSM